MPHPKGYDVLGIGNPCMDYVLKITENYLETLPGETEGMEFIDYPTFVDILTHCQTAPIIVQGGSACNTIKGLANLGEKCAIAGKLGDDPAGKSFIKSMHHHNVVPLFSSTHTPTALIACLVIPDGRRTFKSFIGAGRQFHPDELRADMFSGVRLVHIEGYLLSNSTVVSKAMQLARDAGAIISFDMGSYDMVRHNKDLILEFIEKYVDIAFANEMEIQELTGYPSDKAGEALKNLVGKAAVVLQGAKGCLVCSEDGVHHFPAQQTSQVIDTTGAGDLFASGFLHGYLQGLSLEKCAYFGSLLGAAVVQTFGAELTPSTWKSLISKMNSKQ